MTTANPRTVHVQVSTRHRLSQNTKPLQIYSEVWFSTSTFADWPEPPWIPSGPSSDQESYSASAAWSWLIKTDFLDSLHTVPVVVQLQVLNINQVRPPSLILTDHITSYQKLYRMFRFYRVHHGLNTKDFFMTHLSMPRWWHVLLGRKNMKT